MGLFFKRLPCTLASFYFPLTINSCIVSTSINPKFCPLRPPFKRFNPLFLHSLPLIKYLFLHRFTLFTSYSYILLSPQISLFLHQFNLSPKSLQSHYFNSCPKKSLYPPKNDESFEGSWLISPDYSLVTHIFCGNFGFGNFHLPLQLNENATVACIQQSEETCLKLEDLSEFNFWKDYSIRQN